MGWKQKLKRTKLNIINPFFMTTTNGTQEVLMHHLNAFGENKIDEIMKDYSEESSLCLPDGKLAGLNSIRSFFIEVFKLFPAGKTQLDIKQMIIDNDKAYIAWSADSPVISVPMGTDSFEIENGIIIWHTAALHIISK
jgi:hypothetical protein